jgi:hypothetical protein
MCGVTEPISSTTGAKQGDSLGSLLFALALMGPGSTVAVAHPTVHVVACLDDINIVGTANHADRAFAQLIAEALEMGLTPVPQICAVHGRNHDVAHAAAPAELHM